MKLITDSAAEPKGKEFPLDCVADFRRCARSSAS